MIGASKLYFLLIQLKNTKPVNLFGAEYHMGFTPGFIILNKILYKILILHMKDIYVSPGQDHRLTRLTRSKIGQFSKQVALCSSSK